MTEPTATDRPRRKPGRKPGTPLSPAEQQQRINAAALSTGPVTEAGKAASSRNAWKTGEHSAIHRAHFDNGMKSLLGATGKPCRTTCPKYPCSLVNDGLTKPGGTCLDKQVYVQAFGSIIDALQSGSMEGMHALMASEISAALQMLHDLRAQIADQGFIIGIPAIDLKGNVITREDGTEVMAKYVANPGYALAIKTLETLGINLTELLVTPKSQAQAKVEDEKVDAMQTLMGGIFQRGNASRGALPAPRVIEHGDDGT